MRRYGHAPRLAAASVLAVVALAAVGCGGSDEESSEAPAAAKEESSEKRLNIAFFGFAKANTYAVATFEGVKKAAEANNADATFFDGKFESPAQVAQIEDATVSGKYDAFVIQANDGNAVVPAVKAAADAGIKVVSVFTPIGPDATSAEPQADGVLSYVGQPIDVSGTNIGELFVKACEGLDPCKVAYMPGDNNLPFEKIRTDAIMAVVEQHDNIDVVAQVEGGYLRDTGVKAAQDILQAHPDVNVIGASGDQPILGAEQVVKDAGLTGKVKLQGMGAAVEAVEAIKAKRWFGTVVFLPETEGEKAAEFALKAARGEEVPKSLVTSGDASPIGPLALPDNVADFAAQWNA